VDLRDDHKALDVYNTVFSHHEVASADWIRLCPAYEQGFAQPQEEPGWVSQTLANTCASCGAGYQQAVPYRVSSEPRLGKHDFVSLFGTYAVFSSANPAAAMVTAGVGGLNFWPLLVGEAEKSSKLVRQWVVPTVADPGFVTDLESTLCPKCGTRKHRPHLAGYMTFQDQSIPKHVDFAVSYEWFGSGHGAYREILVSRKVAKLFMDNRWKGVALKPVLMQ